MRLVLNDASETDAFGASPMGYAIVETDGSIQANDALRVCEQSLGETGLYIQNNSFDELSMARRPALDLFLGTVPPARDCANCREATTCGGGYIPHRFSRERGFDNRSVWCADILKLFDHVRAFMYRHGEPR